MKGVLGDGLVGVDWTQAITGHNLTVCGIAGCVFNHIVLKRQVSTVRNHKAMFFATFFLGLTRHFYYDPCCSHLLLVELPGVTDPPPSLDCVLCSIYWRS